MSEVIVTALRCNDCGRALDGLQRDTIFCCSSCHVGWEIVEGRPSKHSVRVGVPVEDSEGSEFHLPFWKMNLEAPAWHHDVVWVAAFHMTRPAFFGDPGAFLTDSDAFPLEAEKGAEPLRLKGVTRGTAQAERYCRLWFDSMAQGKSENLGDISVKSMELWAMPFAHIEEEQKVCCLTSGKEYSSVLVEDLRSMLG